MGLQHLIWLMVLAGAVRCFIMDGPCPAQSPCRCYGSTINCRYLGLKTFPTFNFTNATHHTSLTIDLHRNSFTSIPDNAFDNIQQTGAKILTLKLNENHIHMIHSNAFAHLENVSLTLDLEDNNMTALPEAFLHLNNVQNLHLLGNQIIFLNKTLLSGMSKSLNELQLDMHLFAIWPLELSSLEALEDLTLDQIPFHDLPSYSFNGLDRLSYLTVTNSKLTKVPDVVCNLPNLSQFKFTGNHNLPNSIPHLFPSCHNPSRSATLVNLDKNDLYTFPSNVFVVFPRLLTLSLNFNNLDAIDSLSIPQYCKLYYLYLSYNQFKTIPAAISKMADLITLTISDNHVTYVDPYVFSSLAQFRQLTISNNPLKVVDPHAFSIALSLRNIYASHTSLTSIPAAILHSNKYFSIDVSNSPIECSCQSMAFLKALTRDELHYKHFYGNCVNTTIAIQYYLEHSLPNCP